VNESAARDLFLADYQHLRRCGLNVAQIAERLGQPLETINRRLSRLRAAGVEPEPTDVGLGMPDFDVAVTVADVVEGWLYVLDPLELFTWLTARMRLEPERMAQAVMVLAARLTPGELPAVRDKRVQALLVQRTRKGKKTA
jgi:hypothetical protein